MTATERLAELGLKLPAVVAPLASYVPAVRSANLVYASGQVPIADGQVLATGKLGDSITIEEGQRLARQCAVNLLAAVDDLVGLDNVVRVVRVGGFVAAAEGFTDVPKVVNGASDLFTEVFGDAGKHARAAVGVAELPLGVPVEVDAIFEVS